MNLSRQLPLFILTAGLLTVPIRALGALTAEEQINVLRGALKAERQVVVTESLHLTDAESKGFWPLYHQYRTEMDKVGNGLVKLALEYRDHYLDVSEERAKQMLKHLSGLEKEYAATRASYLKKISKVLPAAKTLRFAQVETRLDLAVRVELAASLPLAPIEGDLTTGTSSSAAYAEGVPGGVTVKTVDMTATVAAVDKSSRKVTLVSPDGIKKTVKVGPEAINFDQIRVGDQLKVTATEQLVVQMAEPGKSADDGAEAVVALAPKGAKPGGLVAETTQVTAKVTAIDQKNRTATLRFEDGSTKTFPVRGDVDLSKRKVGDQVVFRVTEMIAISVEKP